MGKRYSQFARAPFFLIVLGGLLVTIAVQFTPGSPDRAEAAEIVGASPVKSPIGPFGDITIVLFVLGWLMVVYGMSVRGGAYFPRANKKSLVALLGAGLIVVGTLETTNNIFGSPNWPGYTLLGIGWLLVMYTSALVTHAYLGWRWVGKVRGRLGLSVLGTFTVALATLPQSQTDNGLLLDAPQAVQNTQTLVSIVTMLGWSALAMANALVSV